EEEEGFKSWESRKGVYPIVAGPRWAEVRLKLEDKGVNVWWAPGPGEYQEDVPRDRLVVGLDVGTGVPAVFANNGGGGGGGGGGGQG
ncbi:unnamed protein product, partial [Laminaria digitata]